MKSYTIKPKGQVTLPLHIFKLTYPELVDEFRRRYGKGAYHAAALYRAIYQNGNPNFGAVQAFARSPRLLEKLQPDLVMQAGEVLRVVKDGDLIKFTTRLNDGFEIESVVIPMASRYTVCVSSQAGCRMGCAFCETGRKGFYRNLDAAEIVGQVFSAKFVFGAPIRNVVFMGMGEPLDNLDQVLQAIRILCDPRGLNIAPRHITLSTVGPADKILELSKRDGPPFHLAISLNAPNDRIRSKLMPINRKCSMERLKAALLEYPLKRADVLLIEYVLIAGINDAGEHARELSDYLGPLNVRVNVIPLNPSPNSDFSAPEDGAADRFCGRLRNEGLFVWKRARKGHTVMAACGQLGGSRC